MIVVASDIDSHETGYDLADDTAMGMPADQIVVETCVERQVVDKILEKLYLPVTRAERLSIH